MITLYQFSNSFLVCESVRLHVRMSWRICLVYWIGMLEYKLEISNDASLVVGVIGVCFNSCINCVVFLMLSEYGTGVSC